MASDDSDVSAITLSDDDEPKPRPKLAAPPKPALKAASGAGGTSSSRAAAAGAAGGSGTKPAAGKGERRKGRVAFQLDNDDGDDDGDDDDNDGRGGRAANGAMLSYGADADAYEDDGAVEDETKPLGWSYFRKRDASEGPATWGEVDVGELRFVAENLVRSTTKRASQVDDVMQQIFQAAPGDEDSLVPDPLGRGVIDPVTLTLGKRSKMQAARQAQQPSSGEKGLKATMRTFRTARLGTKQQQQQPGSAGAEGAGGSQQAAAAAAAAVSGLDEEARKVLPNQEGFDPEAYLATFHAESSMAQLDKGLRSLSRELSERTGQLKLLIRNNFERFINCKDAIDDIHAKMRKTLVRGGGGGGGASASAGGGSAASPPPAVAGPGAAASAAVQQQQQQSVATDKVFRSLEQVEGQARRTFGPILERAAKADRIRAVASLLQRFDHLFAAPQRVMDLAGRGELEQVVREYKRANMLIRPTPTTARVWLSLYSEIEKRVTEVYLAVKQLVTEPPPEGRPMGQDGPAVLFGVAPTGTAAASPDDDDASRQRLSLLPDYLLFLALVRQERLPAAREEDAMRLYVSRLETHVTARIQGCDKQHTEQLGQLVGAWMRSTAGSGGAAAAGSSTTTPGAAALRAVSSGVTSLQASFTALPRLDAPAGAGRAAGAANGPAEGLSKGRGGGGGEGAGAGEEGEEGGDDDDDDDDLDDEVEAAEAAFLLWHGGLASVPSSAFLGGSTANLPYHIRTELRRLVQEPGGPYGTGVADGAMGGATAAAAAAAGAGGGAAAEPLPSSAHAPEPQLTPAQRQWVSYVCSVSELLLWSLPGLWATCNSPKYGNNADLNDEAREGLERGPSLARRLVEALCTKYGTRLRRAAQSLARAGSMQPGLPLIIKDACHLWSSLRRVGVASRTLSPLRGAVLAALGCHCRVLADHLAELPQRLFGADDFRLDLLAADLQPVTSLPRRLEEEVGVALLHYQWPLAAVVEAAGGVGEVPAESSWRPVQGSVFACFSLLSEALAEYARSLYGSHGDGSRDGRSGFRGKPSGSLSRELESDSSVASAGSSAPQAPGAAYRPPAARASGGGAVATASGNAPRRGTDASDAGAAAEDGQTHGSFWSAGGGGGGGSSDNVRVLLVIGNSAVIRTRVMPGVVERYRKLLAPTPEAAATCQRRLRELTTGMRRSNEALGSSYLERKEADVHAAAQAYMQAATAPLLPAVPSAGAGGASGGAGVPPKRSARAGPAAAPAVGLLPGPSGPSAGCLLLLALLTAIHNEALAYSPSNLRSFMEALAERLVGDLALSCARLSSAAAAGGAAKGAAAAADAVSAACAIVEPLVQLWADLRFLTAALRPLLSEELAADLREAMVDVGEAITARQRARRYRPASAPAVALADFNDGEAVSKALERLLAADVDKWLRLHALNVRCFAAAAVVAPPTAVAAAAAAATSSSSSRSGAGGDKSSRGTGAEAASSPSSSSRAAAATTGRREPGGGGDGAGIGRRQLSLRAEAGRAGSRTGAAGKG